VWFCPRLGIKPIMRPIPEGRHPGQPSRRPCVGRARGAATTPTRFLPKYPDPIFLRCGKPRAAVLAGDAVAWLARRCVIFGFGVLDRGGGEHGDDEVLALETFLDRLMRSPSSEACGKRLERSLGRLPTAKRQKSRAR